MKEKEFSVVHVLTITHNQKGVNREMNIKRKPPVPTLPASDHSVSNWTQWVLNDLMVLGIKYGGWPGVTTWHTYTYYDIYVVVCG